MREHSAGIIIFRRIKDTKLYLLLNYRHGHWGFSKGHIEFGEKEVDAAMREAQEETGLFNIDLDEGFREQIKYIYSLDGDKILKKVDFFLAETNQEEVAISDEHLDHKWLTFNLAYKTLTHDATKELLNKAEDYLNNKYKEDLQIANNELQSAGENEEDS